MTDFVPGETNDRAVRGDEAEPAPLPAPTPFVPGETNDRAVREAAPTIAPEPAEAAHTWAAGETNDRASRVPDGKDPADPTPETK